MDTPKVISDDNCTAAPNEATPAAREHPVWLLCNRIDAALNAIRQAASFDHAIEIARSAEWLTAEIRGHVAAVDEVRDDWKPLSCAPRGQAIELKTSKGEHRIDDWGVYSKYNVPEFVAWRPLRPGRQTPAAREARSPDSVSTVSDGETINGSSDQ